MTQFLVDDECLQSNTSQRLACVLVVDGSTSMQGEAIDQLNSGLSAFEKDLKEDSTARQRVQVAVVRFATTVEVIQPFTDAQDFRAPTLKANGSTPTGAGMRKALEMVEEQKRLYSENGIAYNRPWIFLITDGHPTDHGWERAAAECRAADSAGRAVIFAIGTGEANLDTLNRFAPRTAMIRGLCFKEFFVWLSQSMREASRLAPGSTTQIRPSEAWTIPA